MLCLQHFHVFYFTYCLIIIPLFRNFFLKGTWRLGILYVVMQARKLHQVSVEHQTKGGRQILITS